MKNNILPKVTIIVFIIVALFGIFTVDIEVIKKSLDGYSSFKEVIVFYYICIFVLM